MCTHTCGAREAQSLHRRKVLHVGQQCLHQWRGARVHRPVQGLVAAQHPAVNVGLCRSEMPRHRHQRAHLLARARGVQGQCTSQPLRAPATQHSTARLLRALGRAHCVVVACARRTLAGEGPESTRAALRAVVACVPAHTACVCTRSAHHMQLRLRQFSATSSITVLCLNCSRLSWGSTSEARHKEATPCACAGTARHIPRFHATFHATASCNSGGVPGRAHAAPRLPPRPTTMRRRCPPTPAPAPPSACTDPATATGLSRRALIARPQGRVGSSQSAETCARRWIPALFHSRQHPLLLLVVAPHRRRLSTCTAPPPCTATSTRSSHFAPGKTPTSCCRDRGGGRCGCGCDHVWMGSAAWRRRHTRRHPPPPPPQQQQPAAPPGPRCRAPAPARAACQAAAASARHRANDPHHVCARAGQTLRPWQPCARLAPPGTQSSATVQARLDSAAAAALRLTWAR